MAILKNFRGWVIAALTVVYLLIWVGGMVRATGSGMGCPDWPKCFGMWVPPTDASQLPLNYQQIFGAKLKGEVIFNAQKTWIEYINRLVGAASGIVVFFMFLSSLFQSKWLLKIISFLTVLLLAFEAWLGAKVVSSELQGNMVTYHMFLALLIVLLLVFLLTRTNNVDLKISFNLASLLSILSVVLIGIQILLGSQLREVIDIVSDKLSKPNRNEWISQAGSTFLYHRGFSWIIFLALVSLAYVYKGRLSYLILVLLGSEMMLGITLTYFGFPAFAQPFHLFISFALFGLVWYQFISQKNLKLN